MKRRVGTLAVVALVAMLAAPRAQQAPARKRVLALGDTRTGYTHDSIGHALAVIDHLGRQSGAFDTYIRTDSQWITTAPGTRATSSSSIRSGSSFAGAAPSSTGWQR